MDQENKESEYDDSYILFNSSPCLESIAEPKLQAYEYILNGNSKGNIRQVSLDGK